ncbi:hypothetical protein ACF3NS_14835 [Arsenicicoccus cauae]|uniref:hypothetical protein n=1 Tax=Arsenicicoccus cauae TaxID=2663847 RepID=UPI00370D62C3
MFYSGAPERFRHTVNHPVAGEVERQVHATSAMVLDRLKLGVAQIDSQRDLPRPSNDQNLWMALGEVT